MGSAAEASRGASTEGALPLALPPQLVWTSQSPPRVVHVRIQLPPEAQHTHQPYLRETGAVPPESPLIPHGPGTASPEPPSSHREPGAVPPGALCPYTMPPILLVACFRTPLLSGAPGPASAHPAQATRLSEASVHHARIDQAHSPHLMTKSLQALPPAWNRAPEEVAEHELHHMAFPLPPTMGCPGA